MRSLFGRLHRRYGARITGDQHRRIVANKLKTAALPDPQPEAARFAAQGVTAFSAKPRPRVAIVGGGFAIATGAAFGAKLRGDGRVAVCFFGDGAANQGVFMESMNVSSSWELPTIFICENNGLSESTISSTVTGGALIDRARAFMPTTMVDGNDVLAVRAAAEKAVARARSGKGPSYIECTTSRIRGHLEAEDAFLAGGKYRTAPEIAAWQTPERDPVLRFESVLRAQGMADADAFGRSRRR